MVTPLNSRQITPATLASDVKEIIEDLQRVHELATKADASGSMNDEIQMVLHLSGTEIKLTNFAAAIRKKLV